MRLPSEKQLSYSYQQTALQSLTELASLALSLCQASGYLFRRLKNSVYIDGTPAELGNDDADAEWAIRINGSLRALLTKRNSLTPQPSQLWKLTSVAEGLTALAQAVPSKPDSDHGKMQVCMSEPV